MNIMLTGATGHLGTHITNQAIANHIDHFHIGVRNVEKVPEDWRGKVSVRQLDYFNQESMVEALKEWIPLCLFQVLSIHHSNVFLKWKI